MSRLAKIAAWEHQVTDLVLAMCRFSPPLALLATHGSGRARREHARRRGFEA